MDKKQIFTLLVIGGLIILTISAYYLLKEVRAAMRDRAKQEAITEGIKGAKSLFDRYQQSQS